MKQKTPVVQLFGITNSLVNNGFGIAYNVNIDIAAGYEIPFAYLFAQRNDNLIINPSVFLEIASLNYLEIITPYIKPRIMFDAIGV